MAYSQDHGTAAMQKYVHNHQQKLSMLIDEAKEWACARDNAAFEALDDWTLVCQAAEKVCPHGVGCTYRLAAQQIFARNAGTLDAKALACSLRHVLVSGPKKTARVPFLVGPSNSGKSTLVYPFDDLFSPRRVLHKPALGSSFGLRNLAGGSKRFIFWDDFRPVEFAHEKTVPVSLFLSLFVGQYTEIQVSQSFNDGNKDVFWNRGVVFTGKQEGLWATTQRVSAEDVRHMRNRVEEHVLTEVLPEGSLHDVQSCAHCMAKWIVEGAAAHDAAAAVQPVINVQAPREDLRHLEQQRLEAIVGLSEVIAAVLLPGSAAEALLNDLEDLGAANVAELTPADWQALAFWAVLRPLQKRRLERHLGIQ